MQLVSFFLCPSQLETVARVQCSISSLGDYFQVDGGDVEDAVLE